MENLDEINAEEIKRLQEQRFDEKSLLTKEQEQNFSVRIDRIQLGLEQKEQECQQLKAEKEMLQTSFTEARNLLSSERNSLKEQLEILKT